MSSLQRFGLPNSLKEASVLRTLVATCTAACELLSTSIISLRLKAGGMPEEDTDVGEVDEGDGLKEKSVNTVVLRERSAPDSWV